MNSNRPNSDQHTAHVKKRTTTNSILTVDIAYILARTADALTTRISHEAPLLDQYTYTTQLLISAKRTLGELTLEDKLLRMQQKSGQSLLTKIAECEQKIENVNGPLEKHISGINTQKSQLRENPSFTQTLKHSTLSDPVENTEFAALKMFNQYQESEHEKLQRILLKLTRTTDVRNDRYVQLIRKCIDGELGELDRLSSKGGANFIQEIHDVLVYKS